MIRMAIGRRKLQSVHLIIATVAILCFGSITAPARASDPVMDQWRAADSRTRAFAVALARRAFDTYIQQHRLIDIPANLPPLFQQRAGVFVSTMRGGAPRCCMGTLYPLEPNAAAEIIANAATAAGRDRRFPPIKPGEEKSLLLIVSFVGRPRPITALEAAALDPTRDGLAVRFGDRYGVILRGETSRADLMLKWGRIRAGAGAKDQVELFALDTVRFAEQMSPNGKEHGPGR